MTDVPTTPLSEGRTVSGEQRDCRERAFRDALQIPRYVPSFTTPVEWKANPGNFELVIVDDEFATRTAFIAPDKDGELVFDLYAENPGGQMVKVARFKFNVVSPVAFAADVNKDGKYDFQVDLVDLLRNWDAYGDDAIRLLAHVLANLESDE